LGKAILIVMVGPIFSGDGNCLPSIAPLPGYPQLTPRVLFRNLGNGTFEEMEDEGPGIATTHSSHRCAFGDFDNDGDLNIDRQPE
jgi:hypothetical protein